MFTTFNTRKLTESRVIHDEDELWQPEDPSSAANTSDYRFVSRSIGLFNTPNVVRAAERVERWNQAVLGLAFRLRRRMRFIALLILRPVTSR
jgi:hypothetical protein